MPVFSKTSLERLNTCHADLQRLMHSVIEEVDITILCGHRTKEEQDKAYAAGNSKLRFPSSKHNKIPSRAVDVAPWRPEKGYSPWNDIKGFHAIAAVVLAHAKKLGIKVRWGGDFNMNGNTHDEKFIDLPHWELI